MDDKIEFINATLSKLIDHFEERGEVLMIAWQYVENSEEATRVEGNFMSTSCKLEDRALAILDWASMAEKSLERDSL